MRDRAIAIILQSIDDRFNKELSQLKEITDLVEHAKFVSQDLVEVFERVTKCFPSHYNIFEVYQ